MWSKFLKSLTEHLKRNYLIYVFACLVGFISIGPHLLAKHSLGSSYQGFPLLFQDNEEYYLSRINDILEGYWLVGSPFLYEYKKNLPVVFPVGEYLYAIPVLLTKIDLVSFFVFAKFLFPALLFTLVYLFLFQLSERTNFNRWVAVAGGLLVTLGFDFVDYSSLFRILEGKDDILHLSLWTRPVNPISGILFLFTFLILISRVIQTNKRFLAILAGMILGIMPGYVFSWLTGWAFLGMVWLISFFRKKIKTVWILSLTAISSLIVSIPFWISWFGSLQAADGKFIALRNGLLLTHAPILNKVTLLQTVIFLPIFIYEFYKQKKRGSKLEDWWWFGLALVGANWLTFNYQVIIGRTVWPPHLMQFAVPLAMVTFMLLLGNYFKKISLKFSWILAVLVMSISVIYGVFTILSFRYALPRFAAMQQNMALFDWLNKNAPKDCVVLVRENEEALVNWVPAFTHCNVYASGYAFSRVPLDRLYHNYLVFLRLRGISVQELPHYLQEHRGELKALFYTTWPQLFMKVDESWLAEPIEKIEKSYGDFLKKDFLSELKKYRIDFITGEEEFPTTLINQFESLKYIGKFGSKHLYKI